MKSLLGALGLVALLASPCARAQTVVDDFNDGNDTGWTHVNPLGSGTYSFPSGTSYRIQAPVAASDPGTTGPARAGTLLSGVTVGDFTVSVDLLDWDDSGLTHQAIGLITRVSDVGAGTTNGYFFHYDPHGSNGHSSIWIDGLADEQPFSLGSASVTALTPGTGYRLQFTGTADLLTGSVYLLSDLSTPLYQVQVTDATFGSGFVGLLVADQGRLFSGNQTADATFDNFSTTTAIPEPATSAALAAATCGLAAAVIRRRRSPP